MIRLLLLLFSLLAVLVIGGLWLNWQLAKPSHDRDWRADYARLPTVTRGSDGVTLNNIRNWSYAPDGTPTVQEWITRKIDPEALTQSYFVVEPFGGYKAIAHTMLAFAFDNGETYVVSIEARREKGEVYDALKAAIFPIFEFMFVWTTERDMYGNSEFMAKDQLYLYPLAIPLSHQKAVLKAMIDETEALVAEPRWYNTLFSNCTNVLARAVNKVAPGALPLDISWVLPGYADEFLYENGFLKDAGSFDKTHDLAHISPLIRANYGIKDPSAFSAALRRQLEPGR